MSEEVSSDDDKQLIALVSSDEEEHPIVLTTERRFKRGSSDDYKVVSSSVEEIERRSFRGPVAELRREYGFTINLGNYESARFEMSVKVPCYPEDLEEADDFVKQFVSKRMRTEWTALGGK